MRIGSPKIVAIEQGAIPSGNRREVVAAALVLVVLVTAWIPTLVFDGLRSTIREPLQAQDMIPESIETLGY